MTDTTRILLKYIVNILNFFNPFNILKCAEDDAIDDEYRGLIELNSQYM